MSQARFYLTETAFKQLDDIIYGTARDHGPDQAEKYKQRQLAGFETIAREHTSLRTAHREALANITPFRLHLVEHHDVVYQSHDEFNVIIVGILHERMDIPARLTQLQSLSRREIDVLRREIDQSSA